MTQHADLTALLADAGIIDVDVDKAVEDEHVRWSAYRRIILVAVESQRRDNDRALVVTIMRDPIEMVAKSAVVDLVDKIAIGSTDPVEFQRWSAELLPETERLKTEGNRRFVQGRIRDWTCYLAINAGHTPTAVELTDITDWMQRKIAETSTSVPILTLLAETGRTKKIRNIAKNRAGSREITRNTDSTSR